eukprot:11292077-Alexandrium_andersonii.AAC.1
MASRRPMHAPRAPAIAFSGSSTALAGPVATCAPWMRTRASRIGRRACSASAPVTASRLGSSECSPTE